MTNPWATRVVPWLVEKACRSREILTERQRWVPRASGRVLEVGVGSGLNLAFYDRAAVERVVGLDPSAPLLARAADRTATAQVPIELVHGSGERLPFSAAAFDSVVMTYTLCSVEDPTRVLAEIRRVLAPRGALVLVEHGRAPDPGPRRIQRALTPLWSRIGGGCRLDRDVGQLLEAAGFATADLSRGYTSARRWLSYTLQGVTRAG